MAKRIRKARQLVRGFVLGQLYEKGHVITTAQIRSLGASKATAKRDMKALRLVVPVTPSKPLKSVKHHVAQRALKKAA